jgi:hypothetical protein
MKQSTRLPLALVLACLCAAGAAAARMGAEAPPDALPGLPAEQQRILIDLQAMARGGMPQAQRVVLVPAGEMPAERVQSLLEDLAIMSRVLDKGVSHALEEDRGPAAGGGDFRPSLAGEAGQTLYLDGYGAVFTLRVRFPLIAQAPEEPPAQAPEQKPESLWEQTRREMQEPAPGAPGRPRRAQRPARPADAEPAFRPERVEQLKSALLDSLREASHIRGLAAGDAVSIVVLGSNGLPGVSGFAVATATGGGAPGPGADEGPTYVQSIGVPNPQNAGVLTLHVLKADIEALAAGRLTPEEFAKRATIVVR